MSDTTPKPILPPEAHPPKRGLKKLVQTARKAGRVGARATQRVLEHPSMETAFGVIGAATGGAIGGAVGATSGPAGATVGAGAGGAVGKAVAGATRRAYISQVRKYAEQEIEELRSPVPRAVELGSHTCLVPEGAVTVRGSSSDNCRAPATNSEAWWQYVAYAKWVLDRHDVHLEDKPLGCGTYGCAFGVRGRTDVVVKITGDRAEAAALLRVNEAVAQGETTWDALPALARATCVYGMLDNCDRPLPIFVITQERLPKKLDREAAQIVNDYWVQILDMAAGKRDRDNVRGWALNKIGRRGLRQLDALVATVAELTRIGVHWTDLHEGNVMVDAANRWKIVDLGFSRSPDTTAGALAPNANPIGMRSY